MTGYTTRDVAELLDVSPARVRAFARAGLVAAKRGTRRQYRFSFQDVVLLRAAKELSDAAVPARTIWRVLRALQADLPRGRSLASLRIAADGDRIVVRDRAGSWEPESGQRGFDFEISDLAHQVAPLARAAAAHARSNDDTSSDDWFELALELESVGSVQDAERAYRSALRVDRGNADAHINLGRLLQESRAYRDAEQHYRAALAIDPRDATAAYNLANVQEDLGRSDDAVASYRRALEADASFADAHYNLARLLERRGERAAALRHLAQYKRLSSR